MWFVVYFFTFSLLLVFYFELHTINQFSAICLHIFNACQFVYVNCVRCGIFAMVLLFIFNYFVLFINLLVYLCLALQPVYSKLSITCVLKCSE